MEFLSDDPTYLAGGLAILAGIFLIALKLTQQGKFLVWAGVALGLAVSVVVIERLWVTDNERVEETVYGLARAVAGHDVASMLDRLAPDVQYVNRGTSMPSLATRALAERLVRDADFDFLRISHLEATAGGQSRRGRADFQVLCGGSLHGAFGTQNFGSVRSTWSLGLRETSPGVWKVNRITPVSIPGGQHVLPMTLRRSPMPGSISGGPDS